ncbi:MAG TPA: nitrilase-related carbon-nitrogen hydrolase [Acidimicrobiales bacterium]|nr:nitrilase-related carbon-nitrogen hydrolase [Acidimicrobiales bacterium]
MRVAAIQHDIVWERPAENHARLAPRIAEAAAAGAQLVALSEMYATGFSMNAGRIAEPPEGPSTAFLADQARAHGVWVCASVPTRVEANRRPTNRLVLAGPLGEHHHYDKLHPFSYAGEHDHYAGGEHVVTCTIEGVRVTPFVCYDLRFADDFWAAARDTDMYLVVANWPAARRTHWQILLRARAVENQAYVLGVNRVGAGDGIDYAGDSVVVDPFGEVIAESLDPTERIVVADVEAARVREVRAHYPFLRDRRTFASD